MHNIAIHKYMKLKLFPFLLFPLFKDCCWMLFLDNLFPLSFIYSVSFWSIHTHSCGGKNTIYLPEIFFKDKCNDNNHHCSQPWLSFSAWRVALVPVCPCWGCLIPTSPVFATSVATHPNLSQLSPQVPLYSKTIVALKCLVFSFHPVVLVWYSVLLWVLIRSCNLMSSANDFSLAHLLVDLNILSKEKHSELFLQNFVFLSSL